MSATLDTYLQNLTFQIISFSSFAAAGAMAGGGLDGPEATIGEEKMNVSHNLTPPQTH